MNVKKSLFLCSAAAALVAGLQVSAVSAKNCPFTLPVPSPTETGECLSSNAHSFVRADGAIGSSSATWTFRLNWVAGPTDPKATATLFNADGVTRTKDLISGANCIQATDQTIDGNFGSAQVCVTKKPGVAGAPKTLRAFLSGA